MVHYFLSKGCVPGTVLDSRDRKTKTRGARPQGANLISFTCTQMAPASNMFKGLV